MKSIKDGDTAYIISVGKIFSGLKYFVGYTGYIKEFNPKDGSFLLDFSEYYGSSATMVPRTNFRITRESVRKNYIYLTVNNQDIAGYNPYEYKHIFDKSIWGKMKSLLLWIKKDLCGY